MASLYKRAATVATQDQVIDTRMDENSLLQPYGASKRRRTVLLMILAGLARRGRLNSQSFDSVVICPEEGPLSEMADNLGVTVENIAPLQARFTCGLTNWWGT